jgi:hypothetical protein
MAALSWLGRWNGDLPKIGVCPAVGPSLEGARDTLSEEERYLVKLLEQRPHERATCADDSCFCRQHDRLFGEAAAHTSKDLESNGGGRGGEGESVAEDAPPHKRARRNKAF